MFSRPRFYLRTKIILGYIIVIMGLSISILLINDRVITMKKDREFITNHDLQVHNLSNEIEKNVLDMEDGRVGISLLETRDIWLPITMDMQSGKKIIFSCTS